MGYFTVLKIQFLFLYLYLRCVVYTFFWISSLMLFKMLINVYTYLDRYVFSLNPAVQRKVIFAHFPDTRIEKELYLEMYFSIKKNLPVINDRSR